MSSSDKYKIETQSELVQLVAQSNFKMSVVVKHFSNMTMQKAFDSSALSIGRLSKVDEEIATKCITNLFTGVSLYFDTPLNTAQANLIAVEILNTYEYRQLKVEDLVVICRRIKEANIYKLTIAKILQTISKYVNEREQLAITISRTRSDQFKKNKQISTTVESRLKKGFYLTPKNTGKYR